MARKKMRYRMVDGSEVVGATYEELVAAMSALKFDEVQSQENYRSSTAQRASEMYGVVIDASTDESFVVSMEAAGLIKPIR